MRRHTFFLIIMVVVAAFLATPSVQAGQPLPVHRCHTVAKTAPIVFAEASGEATKGVEENVVPSAATAAKEIAVATESTPQKKVSRLDKVAKKIEGFSQRMTAKLVEKLNVKWSKKTGFQLFNWESATVSIRSGKVVYLIPDKPNRELSLDYHGGSRDEVVVGYSIKF